MAEGLCNCLYCAMIMALNDWHARNREQDETGCPIGTHEEMKQDTIQLARLAASVLIRFHPEDREYSELTFKAALAYFIDHEKQMEAVESKRRAVN